MNSAEAEGNSIDDAIERALQRLGVTREKVDIEIISNSTRGLFGLGGRRAKVRATLRRPLAMAADAPPSHTAPPASPAPAVPEAPPASPPTAPTSRPTSAPPRASAAAPRGRPRAADRQPDRPREQPPRRPAPELPAEAAPAVDAATLERGRSVLAEIVRLTGSQGSVDVVQDGAGVRLVISGDPSGVLIGRRGQTLDALEYVLNRIVAHEDESGARLIVDLEDYRQRRRQALEALARRVAERARRRGKPVTLNPMSPRDRRIVHLALQGDPSLSTRSAGSGFYRKVVIFPAGARRSREE